MSRISERCDDIVSELTRIGSPIATLLRPGLPEESVLAIDSILPFRLPQSAIDLFQWHDGTESARGSEFIPAWEFATLKGSLERYEMFRASDEEVGESSSEWRMWRPEWFPLLIGTDISTIGIVCTEDRQSDGEISCYNHMAYSELEYQSLAAMLDTILEAIKTGVIFQGNNGLIDCDFSAYNRLVKTMNPGYARHL